MYILGIMHKGELVKTGDKAALLVEHPVLTRSLTVLMDNPEQEARNVTAVLEASEQVSDVANEGNVFVISFTGDEASEADLLRELIDAGVRVTSFSRETASMEDVLIKLVSPIEENTDD